MSYYLLIERMQHEIPLLDEIIEKAVNYWETWAKNNDFQEAFTGYVALNLHGFYTGLEKIFLLVARYMEKKEPSGKNWHNLLLKQISNDVPNIRPALISHISAEQLQEYKRFRHVVRNVYTTSLAPQKMSPLIKQLPDLWKKIKTELLDFINFLKALQTEMNTLNGSE